MRKLFVTLLCSGIVSFSFGQEMIQVAGGTFQMGSGTSKNNTWEPVHPVTLSPYAIDKYEITYETWTKVRNWGLLHGYTDIEYGLRGCYGDGNHIRLPSTTGANNPVTCVLWYDAVKWCNARSEMENLNPVYFTDNTFTTVYRAGQLNIQSEAVKWTANGYRLPTEAEWEFAARGGAKSHGYIYSGSNTVDDVAWDNLNSDTTTHPVGQKAANELGLYDMSGNVAEWCWDWGYKYDSTAQTDPKGATLLWFQVAGLYHRVIRGGNYVNSNYSGYSGSHDCYASTVRSILVEGAWWGFVGFRCVGSPNPKLSITTPVLGETILADALYSITWDATGVDSIKIEYSVDDGATFKTITAGIRADAGSFDWQVPDTLSSKCRMVITNLNNPTETAVNENFRIKGYVLTRFKANGDFEAFDPAVHGWQFGNTDSIMWPENWWSQFNYLRGNDPNTGDQYPSEFKADKKGNMFAHSSDFPDWPLYSHTFGVDRCYGSMSPVTYSPSAERYWRYIKRDFKGSCFGFAISSLLEFDFPDAFRAFFPQIGPYTNLIELPVNDYRRSVINQLFQYQFGSAAISFEKTRKLRTPRETLQDAKDNFMSPILNHRGLTLYSKYTLGGKPGGHEVVPYALKRVPNTSRFELLVYDSNCPTGDCPSYGKPAVLIDSLYNTWYYSPLKWGSGILTQGLYLDSPANTYLLRPTIPDTVSDQILLGEKTMLQVMNTTSASISIGDSPGNAIGFADSTGVNTIPDSYPIIPKTGTPEAPIGYVIPSGSYTITLDAFRDSVASVGVFGNSSVFSYWRSDAVSNQTDRLLYHRGMEFRNPDAQTKTVNLEAITRIMDCESGFQILNFAVVQNDSVRLEMPDMDRVAFVNLGPAKTYDLYIVEACENLSGQFNHEHITVPAHSTHYIVPDLQDLLNHPVKIYVDKGNTGIISDSLFILNQVTGIEKPLNTELDGKISLIQVYPNPFTSTTTIKYKVTEPCFVSLKVFNAMGIEVATLVNEKKPVGEYAIDWNASGFGSGFYFCKLQNGKRSEAKKMLLIK